MIFKGKSPVPFLIMHVKLGRTIKVSGHLCWKDVRRQRARVDPALLDEKGSASV
jgi:hypothetical protein